MIIFSLYKSHICISRPHWDTHSPRLACLKGVILVWLTKHQLGPKSTCDSPSHTPKLHLDDNFGPSWCLVNHTSMTPFKHARRGEWDMNMWLLYREKNYHRDAVWGYDWDYRVLIFYQVGAWSTTLAWHLSNMPDVASEYLNGVEICICGSYIEKKIIIEMQFGGMIEIIACWFSIKLVLGQPH